MDSIGDLRRRRIRRFLGCVAFLLGSTVTLNVEPAHSEIAPQSIVCYSIVTINSKQDLAILAKRYHTSIENIIKENRGSGFNPGDTLTIIERVPSDLSRGAATAMWQWPVNGTITSDYGQRNNEFHHGIDIAVANGSPVRAVRAGKVIKTGWIGVYGLTVVLDHGDGIETLYAHNSQVLVKVGDSVKAGQCIAYSGSTGRSTGPHVHFEIRYHGKTIDPLKFLPKTALALFEVRKRQIS